MRIGKRFTLFISNEGMSNINKIITSSEDSGVLLDGATKTGKHEIKNMKVNFVIFSRIISATNNFFSSKRYTWKRSWKIQKRIFQYKFLVLLHPLSNIEITQYINYKPKFNDLFSGNNLLKMEPK